MFDIQTVAAAAKIAAEAADAYDKSPFSVAVFTVRGNCEAGDLALKVTEFLGNIIPEVEVLVTAADAVTLIVTVIPK